MAEQTSAASLLVSGLKGLLFLAVAMGVLAAVFWLFAPYYRHAAPILATGGDPTMIVEGGKELDGAVAMLTTLTTGLFVLVALVARNPLRPTHRPTVGQMALLVVFGVSTAGAYYAGLQAKYAIAEGILAKALDVPRIESQLGMQAWFVAFAGAAAVALIADAFLTVKT